MRCLESTEIALVGGGEVGDGSITVSCCSLSFAGFTVSFSGFSSTFNFDMQAFGEFEAASTRVQ